MPGVEKITEVEANQPSRPQTRISARPTTTGEIANGRSMIVSSSRLPRNS
jgi:hypothetical protein